MVTAETTVENPAIDVARYNGTVTVYNPKTGGHRTFEIKTAKSGKLEGRRVVSLLDGSDNEEDFRGFGFVMEDGSINVWSKCRGGVFDKYARILSNPTPYQEQGVEFRFATRCRVCDRKLTDPVSIELGIGPKCRGDR